MTRKNFIVNPYKRKIANHLAKIWLILASAEEEIRRMEQDGFQADAPPFRNKISRLKHILADIEEEDSID